MQKATIPRSVLTVVAHVLGAAYYSHRQLDMLFYEAGAPGDPPDATCYEKCKMWLARCNEAEDIEAFDVLGLVLEDFMEHDDLGWQVSSDDVESGRARIRAVLAKNGLSYQVGRVLGGTAGAPVRSLRKILLSRDLSSVEQEVERALSSVESDPPTGLTAACSLIEAACKAYIEDEGLEEPRKAGVKNLWKAVSKDIGFDPSVLEDNDLKRILSGLTSIVDGIGALRTHAGSAHGRGRKAYRIEPRHARLTIHAAHTLTAFLIETWEARKEKAPVLT